MSRGYETVHRHEKRDEAVPSDEASRPSDGSIAGKKRHDTDKESSHELASPSKHKEDIAKVITSLLKKAFGKDTTFVLFTDIHLTLEEYFVLTDDRFKYKTELHEGRLVIQSLPTVTHEGIFGFLHFLLTSYLMERKAGRVYGSQYLIILSPEHLYEPDLLAISNDQLQHVKQEAFHGAPKLIIEILTPSSQFYDLVVKAEAYRQFGVQEYWTINYETQTVVVFFLQEDGQYAQESVERKGIIRSRAFPGFWIEVEWLWKHDELLPSDVIPLLLESKDLAKYIKTHGVQKAINALGVDLVLPSHDQEQQPMTASKRPSKSVPERSPKPMPKQSSEPVQEQASDSALLRLLQRLPEEVVIRAINSWPEDKKKRFLQKPEDLMSEK